MSQKQTKEYLIRLFTMDGPPYLLSYEYRKQNGKRIHKEDWPILKQMIDEGVVEKVEKTMRRILYRYTPAK